MHPEAAIHLVGKMLEKLLKEIELLDARKDKHVTDIQRELVGRVHERWAHSSEITSLVKKIEFALDM
jgi:tRNA C32,U32 (ribose-2'-O)-methylase TrmJ